MAVEVGVSSTMGVALNTWITGPFPPIETGTEAAWFCSKGSAMHTWTAGSFPPADDGIVHQIAPAAMSPTSTRERHNRGRLFTLRTHLKPDNLITPPPNKNQVQK